MSFGHTAQELRSCLAPLTGVVRIALLVIALGVVLIRGLCAVEVDVVGQRGCISTGGAQGHHIHEEERQVVVSGAPGIRGVSTSDLEHRCHR